MTTRKPLFLIFANFAILLLVFAMLTQSLFVVQRIAVTEEVAGDVVVQRSGKGEFQHVTKKTLIKNNDVLRAGDDGMAEFKWLDGTRLKMTPNTQLTIKKMTSNTLKKGDRSEFKLTSGKVFVRIMKSLTPTSKFEIETPTAVAAVRGTIFSVSVEGGKTQVAVYKGSVKVSSGDDSKAQKTIVPGEVALSEKSGTVETKPSSVVNADFESQPSIVKPELTAQVKALKTPSKALVQGQTEVGDKVTIDGRPTRVRGNGSFLQRVDLKPGLNSFTVVTTDKHGATHSVIATAQGAATSEVAPSATATSALVPSG